MEKQDRIFVAGHRGLVGGALVAKLRARGFSNLILKSHAELDLRRQVEVEAFFQSTKPDHVFLAAAKVGGIAANAKYPGDFIMDNMLIQNSIFCAAKSSGVKKLLNFGSSCAYPRDAPQPMRESSLMSGFLEKTNEAYAVAKIAGLMSCKSFSSQYGLRFISVIPAGVYGPGDNFDPENSHVVSALIRKFHEAKLERKATVQAWGTGSPRREFLYVDDLAEGCLFLMTEYDDTEQPINLGTGVEVTIKELTEKIAHTVGYGGAVEWQVDKPDGMPRKLLDSSRLHDLGWKAKTPLAEGLKKTYEYFLNLKNESQPDPH